VLAVAKKDLVEQGWVLLLGGALSLTTLVALLTRAGGQPDALLHAFRTFVLVALTPLAMLAARRLIVGELARGLDLLERLPVRLGLLVPLKAAIAAAPLAAGAVLGSTITVQAIGLFSPNVPDDLEGRLLRGAAVWLIFVHGVATLVASLGRRRANLVAAAALGLGLAARQGLVDLAALPPVRLVRAGFLVALDDPTAEADLRLMAGAGVACLALACVLGALLRGRLLRGGGRPVAPPRRRARLRAAGAGRLRVGLARAARRAGPGRARGPRGPRRRRGRAGVTAPDLEARTQALCAALDAALARQADLLGGQAQEVSLEAGPQPDAWTVTRAPAAGALRLRADVGAADLEQPLLVAAVLAAAQDERAFVAGPPGGWRAVLDGLPLWLASAEVPARAELLAAWAFSAAGPEGAARLDGWEALRARVGRPAARAAGGWLLRQVAAQRGPAAVEALAREAVRPRRSLEAALAALAVDLERLGEDARALVAAQATALAALPGGGRGRGLARGAAPRRRPAGGLQRHSGPPRRGARRAPPRGAGAGGRAPAGRRVARPGAGRRPGRPLRGGVRAGRARGRGRERALRRGRDRPPARRVARPRRVGRPGRTVSAPRVGLALLRAELRERAGLLLAALGAGAALGLVGLLLRHAAPGGLQLLDRAAALATLAVALVATSGAAPAGGAPGGFLAVVPLPPGLAHAARVLVATLAVLLVPLGAALADALAGLPPGPALAGPLFTSLGRACGLLALALLLRPAGQLAAPLALLAALAAGALPLGLDPLRLPLAGGLPLMGGCVAALVLVALVLARRPLDPAPGLAADLTGEASPWSRLNARTSRLLAWFLGALVLLAPDAAGGALGRATAAPGRSAATTLRYRLTYPAALESQARGLALRADALHEVVARELGLEAGVAPEAPLEVALAGAGPPARLVRGQEVALDEGAAASLVHVTTRRLFPRVAGAAAGPAWESCVAVLREGLAQSCAVRAVGGDPFWTRFAAGVMHARRPIDPREVVDADALLRERGADALPVLGEAWVEALRALLGQDGPRRVLRALSERAARGAPPSDGWTAWDELLRPLGTDAAKVGAAFVDVVELTLLGDSRCAIALPRLRLMDEAQESVEMVRLVAIPDVDVPPGWDVECRVILGSDPPTMATRLGPDPKGCYAFAVRVSPAMIATGLQLRAQLGLRPLAPAARAGTLGGGAIWEEWQQLQPPR
jgi:hypothetical protein